MCRAMNTMYDVARLDVDTDINASARIGCGSVLHVRRWRPIAFSNVHRELQSNMVPQSFIQEVHYELHAGLDSSERTGTDSIHTVKCAITLVVAGIDPTEIVNTAWRRKIHLDQHLS